MKENLILAATIIVAMILGGTIGWKANDAWYNDAQTDKDLQFAKEFILYQDSIIDWQDSTILEYKDYSITEGDYPFVADNAFVTLNLKRNK